MSTTTVLSPAATEPTASAAPESAVPAAAAEDAAPPGTGASSSVSKADAKERDEARDRRATRKAHAACLARQRHKSFVNGLHDTGSSLRQRVHVLRARKGHTVRLPHQFQPLLTSVPGLFWSLPHRLHLSLHAAFLDP